MSCQEVKFFRLTCGAPAWNEGGKALRCESKVEFSTSAFFRVRNFPGRNYPLSRGLPEGWYGAYHYIDGWKPYEIDGVTERCDFEYVCSACAVRLGFEGGKG